MASLTWTGSEDAPMPLLGSLFNGCASVQLLYLILLPDDGSLSSRKMSILGPFSTLAFFPHHTTGHYARPLLPHQLPSPVRTVLTCTLGGTPLAALLSGGGSSPGIGEGRGGSTTQADGGGETGRQAERQSKAGRRSQKAKGRVGRRGTRRGEGAKGRGKPPAPRTPAVELRGPQGRWGGFGDIKWAASSESLLAAPHTRVHERDPGDSFLASLLPLCSEPGVDTGRPTTSPQLAPGQAGHTSGQESCARPANGRKRTWSLSPAAAPPFASSTRWASGFCRSDFRAGRLLESRVQVQVRQLLRREHSRPLSSCATGF